MDVSEEVTHPECGMFKKPWLVSESDETTSCHILEFTFRRRYDYGANGQFYQGTIVKKIYTAPFVGISKLG